MVVLVSQAITLCVCVFCVGCSLSMLWNDLIKSFNHLVLHDASLKAMHTDTQTHTDEVKA